MNFSLAWGSPLLLGQMVAGDKAACPYGAERVRWEQEEWGQRSRS